MTVFVEVQRGVGGLGAAATPGVGGVAVARVRQLGVGALRGVVQKYSN